MAHYWLSRNEEVYGPYGEEQFLGMAAHGEIFQDDQVCICVDGQEQWMFVSELMQAQPAPAFEGKKLRIQRIEPDFNCESGIGHPLSRVDDATAAAICAWLHCHYPGWDLSHVDEYGIEQPLFGVFDQWLAPATLKLFPGLVKRSYVSEFGEGRRWRRLP